MGIQQIVYVSEQAVEFDRLRLVALLEKARAANHEAGISGVLLFGGGRFAQCIEGESAAVEALYAKIRIDRRHRNVITLQSMPLPRRSFGQWSMGCAEVSDSELLSLRRAEWQQVLEQHPARAWVSPGFVLMEALWASYRPAD